jgi:hypothetical protein
MESLLTACQDLSNVFSDMYNTHFSCVYRIDFVFTGEYWLGEYPMGYCIFGYMRKAQIKKNSLKTAFNVSLTTSLVDTLKYFKFLEDIETRFLHAAAADTSNDIMNDAAKRKHLTAVDYLLFIKNRVGILSNAHASNKISYIDFARYILNHGQGQTMQAKMNIAWHRICDVLKEKDDSDSDETVTKPADLKFIPMNDNEKSELMSAMRIIDLLPSQPFDLTDIPANQINMLTRYITGMNKVVHKSIPEIEENDVRGKGSHKN